MWDVVGIVAGIVVIVLMLQLLDVAEVLKGKLRGEAAGRSVDQRVADLEQRVASLEKKGF